MEGDSSTCTYGELENILLNGSSRPCSLPLEYLRRITNNFSDELLLGEGGFGKVYKGVLQNGKMVAVKRIDQLLKPGVQERQFENEVYHLMRLKHPNIIRFLGYCYETRNECLEHDGKYIFAEMQQKLICLEYLPNGSLDRHLSDESSGHEWHTRYKIIKGVCCGLLYLHEGCQCQFGASIIHLDLKPGNILLDEYMGPKIADFGLSRLFEDNKTQTCATLISGTLGYMAPEYLIGRIVTAKADIYNLGVIITEIITGSKVNIFSFSSPTSYQKFVDGVINNWRNRLGASETDCKQIECCLEIGLGCIKFNREERPTSREIIERLERWEAKNCNVNSNETRPPVLLTHVEEKPSSVSTTGYESIFCAVQPNTSRVRSTAAEDNSLELISEHQPVIQQCFSVTNDSQPAVQSSQPNRVNDTNSNSNSNTNTNTNTSTNSSNTGAGPRPYGLLHRSRPCGVFHQQLSRVMRFITHLLWRVMGFIMYQLSRVRRQPASARPVCPSAEAGCPGGVVIGSVGSPGGVVIGRPKHRRASPVLYGAPLGRIRLPPKDRTEVFTFAQMEAATKGFSLEAKIGEGSFGTVYRGYLPDGREVAIKRWESGKRDDLWFLSDMAFLSGLRHKHLVELLGYCSENKECLLVSEYMRNGALHDHLHPNSEPLESSPSLVMSSWKLRIRILLDASRGIDYLHSDAVLANVHGDINSSNILLDASWRARVSDFGVKAAGTVVNMDPEYYGQHHLTVKGDVYCFGVVMLEVLTGKCAIFKEAEGASPLSVVDYAVPSIVSGELRKVLDPRVPEPTALEAEALGLVAYIAVHCVQLQGKDRPAMAAIAANLQTAFDLCKSSFDGDLAESPSSNSLPSLCSVPTPIDQD